MMPSLNVNVSGRLRGRWRLRTAAWLLAGVRMDYRIGKVRNRPIPLSFEIVVRDGEAVV